MRYFISLLESLGTNAVEGLERTLMLLSAMIKHRSFSCENEWRLILQHGGGMALKEANVFGGKLRMPFTHGRDTEAEGFIQEIVVAPHASDASSRKYVSLPKIHNEGWRYKIQKSKISYRSRYV